MEVRIVKRCKKKDKKEYIEFIYGDPIENKNRSINYKANDIVFVEKCEETGRYEIKKCHTYKNLMNYLYENKKSAKKPPNRSLVIDKFTNVFNFDQSYYFDGNCSANDKERKILSDIKSNTDRIKMSLDSSFDFLSFNGGIVDKLVIGLGNQTVFETGITLHHTYGVPYIPGQAIKGMFRNYVIQNYFQKCDCICSEDHQKICGFSLVFGSRGNNKNTVGRVIFMDSFPEKNFTLVKDVMTPHHKDYYNGDSMPLDLDNPTPINFWAVDKQNLTFQFNIAIDKNISDLLWDEKNPKLTIKEFLVDNLIDALNNYGIGAKTSVGYGYFNINEKGAKKDIRKNDEELQEKLEEEKSKKNMKEKITIEDKLLELKKITDRDLLKEKINDFYFQNFNEFNSERKKEISKLMNDLIK